jgi:hypothetical protein
MGADDYTILVALVREFTEWQHAFGASLTHILL